MTAALLLAAGLAGRAAAFPAVEVDPAWPAAGVTVAVRTYARGALQTIPDGDGGILLAWQDARGLDPASCNCRSMDDLYAQRLDSAGHACWGAQDLAICKWRGLWGGTDFLAGFHPDGAGGAIVIWEHADGPVGTFAQHVTKDGELKWGPEGSTVFERDLGLKFTARSARLGREIWLGLDAAEESRVRLTACVEGSSALECEPPVEITLSAPFLTVSVLPGPRPDACLLVFSTRTASGTVCWAQSVAASGAARAVRILEAAGDGFPYQVRPDGGGGLMLAAAVKATTPARRPPPPAGAPPGAAPPAEPPALPYQLVIQRADETGRPRWGGGVAVAPLPSPDVPFALAASARGDLAVGWTDAGDPAHIRVTVFDSEGRPRWAAPALLADRAERTRPIGLLATAEGWLAVWTEWEAGATESLRVAFLAGTRAEATRGVSPDVETPQPSPAGGAVIVRRNSPVSLERLDPTPGGAFVFALDTIPRAVLAYRLKAQ